MPDSTKRPLKVFLCHASADKPAVHRLYCYLRSKGMDLWLDVEKLLPGQRWEIEIPRALYASDAIIVVLSQNSITKEGYVQREIKFALDKALDMPEGRIFLIPARLEVCELPESLKGYQWVDLFQKNWNRRLMASLNERAAQLGLTPLSTVGEVQPPETVAPVISPASHAQFIPPETAEPEPSISSLPHQEAKEEVNREKSILAPREKSKEESPLAKLPPVVTLPKAEAKKLLSKINYRLFGIAGIILIALILGVLGGNNLFQNMLVSSTPTSTGLAPTTSAFGIGSTMIGKDGMTLLYVPAGEFTMGSVSGGSDESPIHIVYLDAFWIDQTEVTNAMYAECVADGRCIPPSSTEAATRDNYYGNSEFYKYPVIFVSWNDAKAYCLWADRRLPSESEWKKAARGTDGRKYPWGNNSPNNDLLNFY